MVVSITRNPILVDIEFAIKLINLKTEKETKKFLAIYPVTVADKKGNPVLARSEDIIGKAAVNDEEKIDGFNQNMRFVRKMWGMTIEDKRTQYVEHCNKYLQHCSLGFRNTPWKKTLTEEEAHEFQVLGEFKKDGNLFEIVVLANNTISSCCYILLTEMMSNDLYKFCENCGRFFLANTRKNPAYCSDKECIKARQSRTKYKGKRK
jgi:hypothetical protein